MSVSPLPPMGGNAPPLKCGRLRDWPDEASACGEDATWHIIWTSDCANGVVCDEHKAEAEREWAYYAVHPYEMACSMPGAVFVHDENRCIVDEDWLGIAEPVAEVIGA